MPRILITGNGFDLHHNLPTWYEDFMKIIKFILLFLLLNLAVNAQENPPFFTEILNFKKQDSLNFPPKNAVLFIGSSTFTKWKNVQTDFPKHVIINRGFGGSTLTNQLHYVGEVVYPYHPKQVVIYCGENDFPEGATPEIVLKRVEKLIDTIRFKFPKVHISFISIKPSPSREKYLPQMKKANNMIAEMLKGVKRTDFINTADAMYTSDGKIRSDIFLKDNLHMNEKGYAIWQKIMEPYLK